MIGVGEVLADRYLLERRIGEGGMGEVWAARHVLTGKPVAVKILKSVVAEGTWAHQRFVQEVQATCSLDHPAVPTVHDAFVEDQVPVIVMDLFEGETLGARLRREECLPLREVVSVLSPVVEALVEAHEKSIAHRDLKPDNIFLTEDGASKVLDFGLAKLLGAKSARAKLRTKVGVVLGTPSYMAPEQARGAAGIDHRVDMWSLGVILYRCLSGVRPIEGEGAAEVLTRLVTDAITPLAVVAPQVPTAVTVLVGRLLTRDPSGRPGTLREVLEVFGTWSDTSIRAARVPARAPPAKSAPAVLPKTVPVVPSTLPGAPSTLPAMPETLRGAPAMPEMPAMVPNAPAGSLRASRKTRRVWVALCGGGVLIVALLFGLWSLREKVSMARRPSAKEPSANREAETDAAGEPSGSQEPGSGQPRSAPKRPAGMGAADGRPPRMRRGPGGVYLWRDLAGMWQLRIVARRGPRRVGGSLMPIGAPIEDLSRMRLAEDDKAVVVDGALEFDIKASRHGDGLAFRSRAECLRVDIEAAGKRGRQRIFVGRRGFRPERVPFIICDGKMDLAYDR